MNKNINAVVELTEKELEGVTGGLCFPAIAFVLPMGPLGSMALLASARD